MSDAMICIKDPIEDVKTFNKRLRDACYSTKVTDFEVNVVDGQPMVMLFSGVIEADEEDVEEAKADGDDELKVGDLLPEDEPIVVQVCGASALTPMKVDANGAMIPGEEGDAAKSEKRLDLVCEKGKDGITKIRVATGTSHNWVEIPGKDAVKKKEWLPVTKTFVGIAYINLQADAAEPAKN